VKIFSMNGQVVLEAGSTDNMINIKDLSSGLYFMEATNQKGESYHAKFLKK